MKKTSAAHELNGYQLLELLGKGGAGSVYRAKQVSTGQMVALKLLHSEPEQDALQRQRIMARFERETTLCAQLHHPNIVRLLDQGRSAGHDLFAVFEFIPGCTLQEWLLTKGPMSIKNAVHVMAQVLDALACAHAQGIIHRDLKPQNIMVSQVGTGLHIKILDFGIAALMPTIPVNSKLQLAGDAIGTPSYSAPEQLRGEPASPGSDLYAWGLLLLECLTGKAVIQGATLAEIVHKQLSAQEIVLPSGLESHPLGILLHRVLQKNRHERASNAATLFQQLQMIAPENRIIEFPAPQEHTDSDSLLLPPVTLEHIPDPGSISGEQRQITVLCCSLTVASTLPGELELAAFEALQYDQLSLCSTSCQRHGAFLAGALGDSLMFFYGFPQAQPDDAQRAARTALELVNLVRQRSRLLERQQGVSLAISITLHSGPILSRPDSPPHGLTPDLALRLHRIAEEGSILVSSETQGLLQADFELRNVGEHHHSHGTRPVFCLIGEYGSDTPDAHPGPAPITPMIGRGTALKVLHNAWHTVMSGQSGQGRSILIVAEAGMGKSRLVYEQTRQVRQSGCISRSCRCLPEHQNDALYPFLELIKKHLQIHDEADDKQSIERLQRSLVAANCDLEHALPILCSWLGLPLDIRINPVSWSPIRQKKILLLTLEKLIFNMSAQMSEQMSGNPACQLVLEDIHWIDPASLELLTRLIKNARQHPMLLLITSRTEGAPHWNSPFLATIKLPPLPAGESAELIARLIQSQRPETALKPIDPSSLQYLLQRIDGVPLFAEELIPALLAQNSLCLTAKGWIMRQDIMSEGHAAPGHAEPLIPPNLQSFLSARLEQLGSARETAQLAAAIGREFSHGLLINASLSDEARVQSALDQMLASKLILRQRRVQGDQYRFRHALIRDAAYDSIAPNVKPLVHARIGLAMEHQSQGRIEQNLVKLAQHFALAGEIEKAIQYGMRAIAQANRRGLDAAHLIKQVHLWQEHLGQTHHSAHQKSPPNLYQALQYIYGWKEPMDSATPGKGRTGPCYLLESLRNIEQATPLQWAMATYHHLISNRSSVHELSDQLLALSKQSNDVGLLKF